MKTDQAAARRLSLSTAYHIKKFSSWQGLVAETKKLGFGALELNVEVPEHYLGEALVSVENNEISISSLHNYCPKLSSLPHGRSIYSGYVINSDDEHERKLAVEYSKKTIEWAHRLSAKAVVMHLGEIATDPSGRDFAKYVSVFGIKGKLYDGYWNAIAKDRASKSRVYLEKLMRSLDELLPFAADKKILLGMENRFYYHEMPNTEEVERLLDVYKGAPIGYWHDSGHAEIFVRQGWVKNHVDFLSPFKGRTIGMHLHDVRSLSDHFAPGSGDLDFSLIAPFVTDQVLLVIEAHPKCSSSQVSESADCLEKCGLLR
jgi:sugar phosphate isomerase/epimerase